MTKINKVMKFEIIKPIDNTWNELGKVLRDSEYAVWKTANKTVQMTWDWQNITYGYKQRFGDVLKFEDLGVGVKSQASDVYREAVEEFPNVPSKSLDIVIRKAQQRFRTEYKDVLSGTKSIPSFKRGFPIPIRAGMMKLSNKDGQYTIQAQLLSKKGAEELNLPTRFTILTKTGGSAKAIFDRLVSGEYSLRDSEIIHDKRRNKWYFSLTYQFEKEEVQTDKSRVMGVDLGIVYPAYMAFNFDDWLRYNIEGSEIISFRQRIEARRNALLRQSKYAGEGRRGHGRNTLLKPIERLRGKVANFRKTTNHKYSRYIVDMAVKHGVGIIQLEDLSGINNRSKFLKQWSYYELQQFIEYKAKEKGIDVKYVSPKYTSQRCSRCGYIAEGNRKTQSEFKCVACGIEMNADFNAARNIAEPRIEELIASELKRQEHEKRAALAED